MNANEKEFSDKLQELSDIYEEGKQIVYQADPIISRGLSARQASRLMELWIKMRDIAALSMKSTHAINDN